MRRLFSNPGWPTEIPVLDWGESQTTKGPVVLNQRSAVELPRFQRELGLDRVALDFEHNTVPDSDEFKRTREPRSVAAFGTPDLRPGEGLFLTRIEWTPAGLESARNYCDLSPAVKLDPATGEVLGLHSVALTRTGAVFGLEFRLNSAGGSSPQIKGKGSAPFLRGLRRAIAAHLRERG